MQCLEAQAMLDYLAGRLDGQATASARQHIASCPACHGIASDLVLTAAAARSPRTSSYELVRGATIGGYVLDAPLGEGAMGTVWRATRDGAPFAIKLLKSFTERAKRRFIREAKLTAALVHPGLVRVVEVLPDVEAGTPALVLELLVGESLAHRLPCADAPRIVQSLAETMAYVHSTRTVHRDLKPANVFLTQDGAVKILDLGLATLLDALGVTPLSRITRTGETVGSPAYMAPEELGGHPGGTSADVWSLGVVFFEALTGELPFRAPTAPALLRAMMHGPPLLRGLPPVLGEMLATDPAARPSMSAVASELRET